MTQANNVAIESSQINSSGVLLTTGGGTGLNLPAGEWHEIEALEDGTVFVNVFAEGKY